jgi:mannosyltransferase
VSETHTGSEDPPATIAAGRPRDLTSRLDPTDKRSAQPRDLISRPDATRERSAQPPDAATDCGRSAQPSGPVADPEQSVRQPGSAADRERTARGRRPTADWLVIAVPAATCFVVGGYEIGGPSLWRDEAYTKDAIGRPVGQIFALLGHMDAVHGAYYLLMHSVAAAIGTSAAALRFPSLCAMVVATAFTAAIGRRTAVLAQARTAVLAQGRTAALAQARAGVQASTGSARSVPALTGLLSGMVFATAPYMTYYAQMARSYAIVTMFVAIASYLLLRAYPDGRWRWWAVYGAAVALAGLFNFFALLIVPAHGLTLLLTDPRDGKANRGRIPLRWLAACAAAVIVLVPLLRVSLREQNQIGWLTKPDSGTITILFRDFAGSRSLILPIALLALAGIAAGCLADNWRPLNPAAVALPWLAVPPVVLIAASFVKPVYNVRYVEFCLPALAILVGAGLTGLIRLAQSLRRSPRLAAVSLAWLPAALAALAGLITLGLAVMLIGPQAAIRQTAARPDNLRLASAIVAAHERPGDVVFYIPGSDMHVLGTGYPAPFEKLRDIALARSPIASATLTGTEITSPAQLAARFTDVTRVWVVTGNSNYRFPVPSTPVDKEKMALLSGMHIVGRWMAGEVMLTLYARN